MKINLYSKTLASMLVGTALMAVPACTDSWDEHYQSDAAMTAADAPSLYEYISQDASLANFMQVLTYTGHDELLKNAQTHTVWAPVISKERANALCALYDADKNRTTADGYTIKDEQNDAIKQFVNNHIALYPHSVGAGEQDSVRMLNGKFMTLEENTIEGRSLLAKNQQANNGIFYKVDGELPFHANLRERVELDARFDSIKHFFRAFDVSEIDEESSVRQGIVNGQVVYADSVRYNYNQILNSYAYIEREDSNYIFLAPTNTEWKRQYDRFFPMFNYVADQRMRDSLQQVNTYHAILGSRFFNINLQKSIQDSITNTRYNANSVNQNWGIEVFPKPYSSTGIFAGLTPDTCSNGLLYVDNGTDRLDPHRMFLMTPRYNMATRNNELMMNSEGKVMMNTEVCTTQDTVTCKLNGKKYDFRGRILDKRFLEVAHTSTASNAEIYYILPYTLSNVYYNVYLVTCPAIAYNPDALAKDTLPTQFRVKYMEALPTGSRATKETDSPNENLAFPSRWSSNIDVPPLAQAYVSPDANNAFRTRPNAVDIICIDQARKPIVSSYERGGDVDGVMRYCISTWLKKSKDRDVVLTNHLRINRLIYVAFETEEEANSFDILKYLKLKDEQ